MKRASGSIVGVNISTDYVDVAVGTGSEYWQWPAGNNTPDVLASADRLAEIHPGLIVVNISGGLSGPMLSELLARRLPVAPVDVSFVHARGAEIGLLSSIDAIDGRLLACFGEAARLQPANLPERDLHDLSALVTAHRQAFEALTSAKHSRVNTPLGMRTALDERIGQLSQELKALAEKIDCEMQSLLPLAVQSTASWQQRSRQHEGNRARRVFQVGRSVGYALRSLRRQPLRVAAAGAVLLAILGLAGFYVRQVFRPLPQPVAVIEIVGSMDGFSQKVLHVKRGRPVTVRLINPNNMNSPDGDGKHQWAVKELGINLIAEPRSSNSVTFTPTQAGTFTFYCDVCCGGRANPAMDGTLIVEG